jgi:hypothetical protein
MEAEPRALDPEEEWRGEDTIYIWNEMGNEMGTRAIKGGQREKRCSEGGNLTMSDPRFDVLSTSSSIAVTSRAYDQFGFEKK